MPTALDRSKVKKGQTWNAESVFPSPEAFDAEVKNLVESLAEVKEVPRSLGDNPETFLDAMEASNKISQRATKVRVYATMSSAVDATNQEAAAMNGKAGSVLARVSAATSFIDPELLTVGETKLRGWLADNPQMKLYEHYFDDLFRKQTHVRNAEVEELLGMLSDPFRSTSNTVSMLANADFKFKPAHDSKNKKIELTQSTYNAIMGGTDRKARRTAWKNYNDKYLEFKNTLAGKSCYVHQTECVQHESANFNSSLEATLFNGDVPVEMFHNLLDDFQKESPTLASLLEDSPQSARREDVTSL